MNKSESKYFHTALRMDKAFLALLEEKDFAYISVKEICERAGVNRSTFYLHYETIGDLLEESLEYMHQQFTSYFSWEGTLDVGAIGTSELKSLYLISPEYLEPFLQFVRDHRRLYKAAIEKSDVMGSRKRFRKLFLEVFSPIMARYHIPEEKRSYMMQFYISGIIGVVKAWIEDDCRESMELVLEVIMECIQAYE